MKRRYGFTIVEMLTTISVVAVLMAVLVPALHQARVYGRRVLNIHHQREIVTAITLYACENKEFFPPSVALCQQANGSFRWQDPRKTHTTKPLWRMEHRSLAGYLDGYMDNPALLFCPSSPEPYAYWQEAWQQGDDWDHPETLDQGDPVFGSYCFYWNYTAYQPDGTGPFRGPRGTTVYPGQSTLLVSDYFGADEWRKRGSFGACEPFQRPEVVAASDNASAYWAREREGDLTSRGTLNVRLHAGFVDGHVTSYSPADTAVIEAAETPDGSRPYWRGDERWPGCFFIPKQALTR